MKKKFTYTVVCFFYNIPKILQIWKTIKLNKNQKHLISEE